LLSELRRIHGGLTPAVVEAFMDGHTDI